MFPRLKNLLLASAFIAGVALSGFALPHSAAFAQSNGQMVMVTPEGDILDFLPANSEVTVRYDRNGRRTLVDFYGNVIATEMSIRRYQRKFGGELSPNGDQSGFEQYPETDQALGEDFFPEAPVARVDPSPVEREPLGDITGSVPEMPPQDDQLFGEQPVPDLAEPDFGSNPDLVSLPPQNDGIEPQPTFPTLSLKGQSRAEITALQVFLDREGISPGVIDGKAGSNVSKAVDSWQKMTGETLDVNDTESILARLGYSGGLPIVSYTITSADAAGPYVAAIPEDYSQKALLPSMAFTSVTEALAERFHMDEDYLKQLNPGVDFTIPGSTIKVVNPGQLKQFKVARIVADKGRKQVFAYDASDMLVAAYPATIGSSDTPSPSGIHAVARIALNPNYTYNPKINFQQGANDRVLTIQPGPNTPVGNVWIALDKPTYGIHGTPEPSRIGKTQSHGCIRLTNWDATELAKMVEPGVTVEFIE